MSNGYEIGNDYAGISIAYNKSAPLREEMKKAPVGSKVTFTDHDDKYEKREDGLWYKPHGMVGDPESRFSTSSPYYFTFPTREARDAFEAKDAPKQTPLAERLRDSAGVYGNGYVKDVLLEAAKFVDYYQEDYIPDDEPEYEYGVAGIDWEEFPETVTILEEDKARELARKFEDFVLLRKPIVDWEVAE